MKVASWLYVFLISILSLGIITPLSLLYAADLPTISLPTVTMPSDSLEIKANPQYPNPNESVTVSLSDSLADLDEATIVWSLNGKTQINGTGATTFTFTAGAAGVNDVIDANVTTVDGETITKDITVIPTSVDLIWQANSYVPPFYKGKALFPNEGTVTITAIPHFGGSSKNYKYTWEINGQADQVDSGYNKNSATIYQNIIDTAENISVTVTSLDGTITGTNQIDLNGITPQIALYEDNPLYGILFNRSLTSGFTLKEQEVNLIAEPFFYNVTDSGAPNVVYKWSINDAIVSDNTSQNTLTLRAPGNSSGSSIISTQIQTPQLNMQVQTANTTVSFSGS